MNGLMIAMFCSISWMVTPQRPGEIARYRECCVSVISWMELLAGAQTEADENIRRGFLAHFRVVPLTPCVAEEAVTLRRNTGSNFPTRSCGRVAISENCLLVSRNTQDLPAKHPGVRFPYPPRVSYPNLERRASDLAKFCRFFLSACGGKQDIITGFNPDDPIRPRKSMQRGKKCNCPNSLQKWRQ